MSKSAFTLKAFGIYLLALGVVLVFVPNLLLSIFNIPETSEVWIRVVSVLAFNIGFYYIYAAKFGAIDFFGGIWTYLTLKSEEQRAQFN